MAVPKKRQSKSRSRMRSSQNMKVSDTGRSLCPQCQRPKLPHFVCNHCGSYKGREVISQSAE